MECSRCACPILIIEDQRSIASLLQALIKDRYGYASVIAGSMKEAELAIQAQPIHLAISDLNLPDAPYGEVIDLLSRHKISTIALTGAFGQEMRETILKKGAIDYIPKQNVHSIEYAVEMANRIYENHHTKVMVVDDSMSSKAILKHVLEKMQFEVFTVSDADEALSALEKHPDIRLALVDYAMPGMNGFELIHEIRKKSSKENLSIIGISGADSGEMAAQFLKSGANDYIKKPFSYEEILCRVGQNLEVLDLIRSNREAAFMDYLTELHNRRYFFQEGGKLHSLAKSKNSNIVAVMIDIDHFKKINDRYGHAIGDEALKQFADLLLKHFGKHLIARIGGEEFAALILGEPLAKVHKIFEAFRVEIENTPIRHEKISIPYTVSIGMTDQPGETIDEFVKAADQVLYTAKMNGRNKVVSVLP